MCTIFILTYHIGLRMSQLEMIDMRFCPSIVVHHPGILDNYQLHSRNIGIAWSYDCNYSINIKIMVDFILLFVIYCRLANDFLWYCILFSFSIASKYLNSVLNIHRSLICLLIIFVFCFSVCINILGYNRFVIWIILS